MKDFDTGRSLGPVFFDEAALQEYELSDWDVAKDNGPGPKPGKVLNVMTRYCI